MFTGIVQGIGTVRGRVARGEGARLSVDAGPLCEGLRKGDSVSVSGVCLTAVAVDSPRIEFDVNRETLEKSTLGTLRTGARVNLEKALLVGDPLGGHFVLGHADGVGEVGELRRKPQATMLRVAVPQDIAVFLVEKGSVAVDGVSLTVVDVFEDGFTVTLIPETLASTTLSDRTEGDEVNVETDILTKTIVRYIERKGGKRPGREGLTMEGLSEAGFL
ncbi:MAG: riboflavin synthase [Planctomycetota bacterium]|jgi:riboflavin synthase